MDEDEFADAQDEMEERDEAEVYSVFGTIMGGRLIENGFMSLEEINDASDKDLTKISGIGKGTVKTIRKALAERGFGGVSEPEATPESEVKPDSEIAEAAEEEIAELSSAEEAPAVMAPVGAAVIRSLFPAHLRLTAPSGAVYEWVRSGVQVNVAAEDVEFVMGRNRNVGRACCGSSGERLYFELA
jgi:hypothetical protein